MSATLVSQMPEVGLDIAPYAFSWADEVEAYEAEFASKDLRSEACSASKDFRSEAEFASKDLRSEHDEPMEIGYPCLGMPEHMATNVPYPVNNDPSAQGGWFVSLDGTNRNVYHMPHPKARTIDYQECYEPAGSFTPNTFCPPLNTEYTQVGIHLAHHPEREELMKYIIGKAGSVFKSITFESGVDYIWYNAELDIIQIWGMEDCLEDAKDRINARIEEVISPDFVRN